MAKKQSTNNNKSLVQVADGLVKAVAKLMRMAISEEDLRIGFEKALEPISSELGIKTTPRQRRGLRFSG